MASRLIFALSVLFALSCGDDTQPASTPGESPMNPQPDSDLPDTNMEADMASPDMEPDAANDMDALPPLPGRWPESERLTHDVDRDLARVLETENLEGACDRWNMGARDELTKMRCGKWMFFYETFGTVGVPSIILDFAQKYYVDYYGVGFTKFGFVADPASTKGMPIGLAPSTGRVGNVATHAFTCASCHFGQMKDGRYAVGYGNLNLDYGRFIAGLGAPLGMSINENSEDVHPTLRAELLPYVQAAKQQQGYLIESGTVGLQLLGAGDEGRINVEEQGLYLALRVGTMDFLAKPAVDDGVWTVSRILSLWNLPDEAQRTELGMPNEMLSWTGGSPFLQSFISGFVAFGVADQDAWTPERIQPLEDYIRSLRTPPLEQFQDPEKVEQGKRVFVEANCTSCHVGPSGESAQTYGYDEIGTDDAMKQIFNPDANGDLCCGFESGEDSYIVTGGIKAPRMTGLENLRLFLHNGSVDSLEQLLCLEPRPSSSGVGQGSDGHTYGCDLSEAERDALMTYLLTL